MKGIILSTYGLLEKFLNFQFFENAYLIKHNLYKTAAPRICASPTVSKRHRIRTRLLLAKVNAELSERRLSSSQEQLPAAVPACLYCFVSCTFR